MSGDDPHIAPLLDLIDAIPDAPLIRDRIPAGQTRPYIRAYVHIELAAEPEALTHLSDRALIWLYVHSVGDTDQAASTVAYAVRQALVDVTPTVPGRVCWPIRMESSRPPRPDESTGEMVIAQVDVYRLESVPG